MNNITKKEEPVDSMTTSETEELMDSMTTSKTEELVDNVTTSEWEECVNKRSMLNRKLKEMMLKTSQFHLESLQIEMLLSKNKDFIDELMESELEECGGEMSESEAEEYLEYILSVLDFIECLHRVKLGWDVVIAAQEFLDAVELAYGEKE